MINEKKVDQVRKFVWDMYRTKKNARQEKKD